MSRREQKGGGAMLAAAVLGLVTCALGVASVFAGGAVRMKSMPSPRWLQRYAVLQSVVDELPRVGFWGSKRDFFRAQYVLAPSVLEAVDAGPRSDPAPSVVIVDAADPVERDAALAWLRRAAERRGTVANVRAARHGLLLVDLRPEAGQR